MAKIGYIRVSSQDQNLDRQVAMLNQLEIDKLFQEKQVEKIVIDLNFKNC